MPEPTDKHKRKTGGKGKPPWRPIPTRKTTTIEEMQPGEVADDADQPRTPEDEDVDELLGQLAPESRVELSRWSDALQDWAFVGKFPPQNFSKEMVQRMKGAGKYRVEVFAPTPDVPGRLSRKGRRTFVVDGLSESVQRPPTSVLADGMADMMKLQMEMLRMNMSQPPRESMADVMKSVVELIRPALTPHPPASPLGGLNLRDILAAITSFKELMGGGTNAEDIMALIEKGMEIGAMRGGGDGDPVASALGVIGEAIKAGNNQPAAPPRRDPAIAGHIPPAASPAPAAMPLEGAAELTAFLETARAILLRASRKNGDPELYAELLADQIPESFDQQLGVWFNEDTYPDMLLPMFGGIDPNWLRLVFLELRATLTEPEAGEHGETGTVDSHADAPAQG